MPEQVRAGDRKSKRPFFVKRECMSGPVVVSRRSSRKIYSFVVIREARAGPTNACSRDAADGTENLRRARPSVVLGADFSGPIV